MKILYIIQQSIYNNDGKWISADSNPMMTMGIIDQLLQKTDWNIDVMIAPISTFSDINDYYQLMIRPDFKRVRFIPREGPVSAFTNRYHFDIEFFTRILHRGQYDVIINNIIELTRNIKTVLYELKLKSKLIVGNYWIDCPMIKEEKVPLEISYDFRQIDGAECADLVSFTCDSTKHAFLDNCFKRMNIEIAKSIELKSTIWDFGFSAFELDSHKIGRPSGSIDCKKLILFPNRLSMINYTHHEEFIKAINNLYNKRQDFEVVFTNPSQKISWEYLRENVKPLLFIQKETLDRTQYIRLLWASDIIISLYTIERYGGCANVEGIYCGLYPVMTNFGEYKKRVKSDFPLVDLDLNNLELIINIALDNCQSESDNERDLRRRLIYETSSYERVSEEVIRDIEQITKR